MQENLVFTNFLIKSVKNLFAEKFKKSEQSKRETIFPAMSLTTANVNRKTVPLPVNLQAPPLFGVTFFEKKKGYADEGLDAGYYLFEKAMEKLILFFPNSDIKIVYLPSTLSSYQLDSQLASFRGNMGDFGVIETKKLFQRHFEVCREILKISKKLNISFFDTSSFLREASSKGYIHGPKDWDHLNESGYIALSESIAQFILNPDVPYKNCANLGAVRS